MKQYEMKRQQNANKGMIKGEVNGKEIHEKG